jgi:hypothetical protein
LDRRPLQFSTAVYKAYLRQQSLWHRVQFCTSGAANAKHRSGDAEALLRADPIAGGTTDVDAPIGHFRFCIAAVPAALLELAGPSPAIPAPIR